MTPDNRNFILAMALSLLVVFGWTTFVQMTRPPTPEDQTIAGQTGETGGATGDPLAVPNASGNGTVPAGAAEAAPPPAPRIPVDSARVTGSINLAGARLDDLHLDEYRETVDPNSDTIVFLKPETGTEGAFIELGWQSSGGTTGNVPDGTTVWSAPADARLTPETPVTLTFDSGNGLRYERTIALDDAYMFTVTDKVTNNSGGTVSLAPYGRFTRTGDPEVSGFWVLHEGAIGVFDGKLKEEGYKKIREDGEVSWDGIQDGWVGFTDKYWAGALIPEKGMGYDARFVHSGTEAVPTYQADFRGEPLTIADGATIETGTLAFAGAKEVSILDDYQSKYDIRLFDRLVTWGWFWFFTKPLFYLIDIFYGFFGNFGFAILAVTVVVKAAFFPLANASYRSMSAMRKLQPKMQEIREKFEDDKAKQQQELMALYKTEKINPLAGCWPVLIQIPVFFSLYSVLFVTIEMRHAPFFGWIRDLAAPDPTTIFNLFGLIPWDPPQMLMVGVWPLVMGVTMFLQMKLNPTPPDPTQAIIFTWMPVIFTFMLANFPAGLVIYWAWNNALSIAQQYFIMRRQGVEIDFFGNIASTFRRKPAAAAATAGGGQKVVASNDDEPAPRKERKAVETAPVDTTRKVRPKNAPKRGRNTRKTTS